MTGFDSKRAAAENKQEPWNEDEWRRNNWRCHHGWLRGEQCEICNAAQEPYDQTALELCGVCGWKTLIPDDGCLNCERAQPAQEPVKLWLWKNFVDGKPEYWAFDNPFPIFMDSHDPQTLGEPCGYAWFKLSRAGRTDVSDKQVLQDVQEALSKPAQEPDMLVIAYQSGYYDGKKAALAQPVQKPINLLEAQKIAAKYGTPNSQVDDGNLYFALKKCLEHIDAQPAQEPIHCQPLTNERIDEIHANLFQGPFDPEDILNMRVAARAIEAAHGIGAKP